MHRKRIRIFGAVIGTTCGRLYRSTIKSWLKETMISHILFLTVDLEPIIQREISQKEKWQKRHRCKEQNFGFHARR